MKVQLKKILNGFIYGGHLVSIGPACIINAGSAILNIPQSFRLLSVIYLITHSVYTFDRYIDFESDRASERKEHLSLYKIYIPFILSLCILLASFLLINQNIQFTILCILLLFFGFGYTLYFKRFTRFIAGFKSFYVALVYSSVVFLIPFYNATPLNFAMLLLFLFFFLRLLQNATFFDMKDITEDRIKGLRTFSVILDKRKFYHLISILNFISVTPIILGVYFNLLPFYSLLLLLTIPYAFYYFWLANTNPKEIHKISHIWADGELILWPLLVWVGIILSSPLLRF